jgi:UDP-2,3-diacylglucosamine pyrophosphatase LpxH
MEINQLIKKDLQAAQKKIDEGKVSKTDTYKLIAERYNVHPERVRKHHRILISNLSRGINETNAKNEYVKVIDSAKGTMSSTLELNFEPKSEQDLIKSHKVDTSKYVISRYYQRLLPNGKYTSTIEARLIKEDSPERFQDEFMSFLKGYRPTARSAAKPNNSKKKPNASLILPKQDAHYNKFDIYGNNDINERFAEIEDSIHNALLTTIATKNISESVYLVGSDEFNSEWTNMTTKGTPQVNILSYQEGFEAICNHEIRSLQLLLSYSDNVKVVFIPGNHDEFAGWHLINWLSSYFRNEKRIQFDTATDNTKYYKFGTTAVMFNHGDVIKPSALAQKFPIGFKEGWSSCDHYIIITGDKHTELSMDIHGIKFYRVPQLSKSTSKWDEKQGYTDDKAEMNAFIISETNGVCAVLKDIL